MKEKPILFSTPMVKVLLNTKPNTWPPEPIDPSKPYKWMTQRVLKPQPREIGKGERLIIEVGKLKIVWRGIGELWDSLNAKRGYSWERNPCVYVYEFIRLR
jgi:hypothetical protein